jgi:hypothetical protein
MVVLDALIHCTINFYHVATVNHPKEEVEYENLDLGFVFSYYCTTDLLLVLAHLSIRSRSYTYSTVRNHE